MITLLVLTVSQRYLCIDSDSVADKILRMLICIPYEVIVIKMIKNALLNFTGT